MTVSAPKSLFEILFSRDLLFVSLEVFSCARSVAPGTSIALTIFPLLKRFSMSTEGLFFSIIKPSIDNSLFKLRLSGNDSLASCNPSSVLSEQDVTNTNK